MWLLWVLVGINLFFTFILWLTAARLYGLWKMASEAMRAEAQALDVMNKRIRNVEKVVQIIVEPLVDSEKISGKDIN